MSQEPCIIDEETEVQEGWMVFENHTASEAEQEFKLLPHPGERGGVEVDA